MLSPRVSSLRIGQGATWTSASTSTGMLNGSWALPTAERAAARDPGRPEQPDRHPPALQPVACVSRAGRAADPGLLRDHTVTSWTFEEAGVLTGLVYGPYHYTCLLYT